MDRYEIETRRGVAGNIGLGIRFLLSNFGAVFSAYFKYIFPFALIIPAILIFLFRTFSTNDVGVFGEAITLNTLNTVLFKISIVTISLLSILVVTAAMKAYRDKGFKNINSNEIRIALNSSWKKQITFLSFFILGVTVASVILYFIWSSSTAIGVLFLIILTLGFIYFVARYIMVFYALGIEGDNIKEAVERVARYREFNIGSILGVIVIGYFASYVVRMILSIPIGIVTMVYSLLSIQGDLMPGDLQNFAWIQIGALVFESITGSIGFLFLYCFVLMKYFDIKERTDDIAIREKIEMIGSDRDLFYENEGEY